jgi:hypothetical protein
VPESPAARSPPDLARSLVGPVILAVAYTLLLTWLPPAAGALRAPIA